MKLTLFLIAAGAVAISYATLPDYTASILTRSTTARGVLRCGKVPAKNVHVRLYRNHTEVNEDILDYVVTKDDGSFSLEGNTAGRSANETGIAPTLRFYHKCDEEEKKSGHRKFAYHVNGSYVTLGRIPRRTFDLGTLNIELGMPGEAREKKFEPIKPTKFS